MVHRSIQQPHSFWRQVRSSPHPHLSELADLLRESYTDENGLNYFTSSKGKAPPPGTLLPESFSTPGGGRTWPRYVVQYTGQEVDSTFQPQLTLYDYAVAGAVCSNEITPRNYTRFNGVDTPFPDVLSYEVPNFQADLKANRINTSAPYFTPPLTATQAVYTIWIGTNDLGVSTFLQNAQRPGKTIVDFTECVFQVLDEIYAAGGRYFVILNQAPLYLAPLYANSTLMGVDVSHYWPDKPTTGSNLTEVAEQIKEEVTLVNDVYKYQIPYENLVANRYPGANFALFDVNSLVSTLVCQEYRGLMILDGRHSLEPRCIPEWHRASQCDWL